MNRVLLFFTLAAITAASCSPRAIHRVHVEPEDIAYYQRGQAIGQVIHDNVIIEAVYSHEDRDNVYYDVAIKNTSSEPLDVLPMDFRLVDQQTNKSIIPSDPEFIILGMDINGSKTRARRNNIAIATGVVAVGATVAAASLMEGGGDRNTQDGDVNTNIIYQTNNVNSPSQPDVYHDYSQAPLLSIPRAEYQFIPRRELWTEMALRRNTLFKDEFIRGLLVFPRNDEIRNVELRYKGNEKGIAFKHQIFKP